MEQLLSTRQKLKTCQTDKDELRRKTISIIFQDNNLLSDFTAIENIMMPLLIRVKIKDIYQKAKKILQDIKIKIDQTIFQANFQVANNKE